MLLRRLVPFAAGLACAVMACGCNGGPRYVGVSGVVTLNGKPYKSGVISFQPVGTKDNPNPGRGSSGYTDENGRFTLKTDDGHDGAVVGKHRVRIMTKFASVSEIQDGDPKNPAKVPIEPIPPEWHATSTKEFDVPAAGTDQATFHIVTKKK